MKRFLAMAVVGFMILGIVNLAEAYNWLTYNDHWYALTEINPWVAQEAEAVAVGGHLVTINDASENAWLAETFKYVYPEALNIGYYFDTNTDDWRWASGEAVTYTNLWHQGSPGSGYDWDYYMYIGKFGYLHTNSHPFATGGSWNHADWVTDYPAIGGVIEMTTNPNAHVPEPTTMLLLGLGLVGLAGVRRRCKK